MRCVPDGITAKMKSPGRGIRFMSLLCGAKAVAHNRVFARVLAELALKRFNLKGLGVDVSESVLRDSSRKIKGLGFSVWGLGFRVQGLAIWG